MKTIKCCNYYAQVDDNSYAFLSNFKWTVDVRNGRPKSVYRKGSYGNCPMQHHILKIPLESLEEV